MSKFRVGDRVRAITSGRAGEPQFGDVGAVVGFGASLDPFGDPLNSVHVRFDDVRNPLRDFWFSRPEAIERISDRPELGTWEATRAICGWHPPVKVGQC